MTIGDMRAARIPVRETILRTVVLTPHIDDAAKRASDVLLAWLNQKIAPLGVGLTGAGRITKRDGNLAVDATMAPDRLRFVLDEESRDRDRSGFVWSVITQLHAFEGMARIDVRVEVEHPYGQRTGTLGSPRFLGDLIRATGLEDVRRLSLTAWRVESPGDVDEVIALIGDPRRALDVVVMTEPLAVDADVVTARLAGVAHVVVLDTEATWRLSALKTKQQSVYGGAVKSYQPGHDWNLSPRQAPMWLPDTIRFVQRQGGSHAFLDELVRQRFAAATARFERLALEVEPAAVVKPSAPLLQQATTVIGVSPMIEAPSDAAEPEKIASAEQASELQSLRAQIADLRNEVSQANAWTTEVEATNRQLEVQVKVLSGEGNAFDHLPSDLAELARSLTAIPKTVLDLVERVAAIQDELAGTEAERDEAKRRLYSLQAQVQAGSGAAPPNAKLAVPVIPWGDGDAFAALIAERYDGNVVVSPRAMRSFEKGDYTKADTLIAYLDFIANEYRDYLIGEAGAHERYRDRARALHVHCGPSVTQTGSGIVDGHSMTWNGRKYAFEHVRSPKTYDPRRMLAIYFFRDPETDAIVIAHLPSHLDNASNRT